jgi:hypothetical protein
MVKRLKHRDILIKFLGITERKVCIVDEYGDENWDVLAEEVPNENRLIFLDRIRRT